MAKVLPFQPVRRERRAPWKKEQGRPAIRQPERRRPSNPGTTKVIPLFPDKEAA